jgi:hypothetical protein
MDLLNHELEIIELALEAALLQLQHKYTPADLGDLDVQIARLSDRVVKELQTRHQYDAMQFEQLAKF